MVVAESLIQLGTAVSKSVIRLWLKDRSIAADAALTTVDLLGKRLTDPRVRRKTARQFEQLAEEVADKLGRYFDVEYGGIASNERAAAAIAVSETIDSCVLDEQTLLDNDLEPARLEELFFSKGQLILRQAGLSEAGVALYKFALREACNYIVEIAITLPSLQMRATREILRREGEIIAIGQEVLSRLPEPAVFTAELSEDAAFEIQYRRDVARNLDTLELYGVTVSERARRYNLSVAYITLTASPADFVSKRLPTKDPKTKRPKALGGLEEPTRRPEGEDLRVDEALALTGGRTVIRGEAGSGKTTLLQWLAVKSARHEFEGNLASWNNTVPFFLRMRQYATRRLPRPEEFVAEVTPAIAGLMPPRWVNDLLTSGRALVIVDGLDELPANARTKARRWLSDLVNTYPKSRVVASSRPPAVGLDWLVEDDFKHVELQPMTPGDILSFIDRWYTAAAQGSNSETENDGLTLLKQRLVDSIRDSASLRGLATSPLLCALLCALNSDRRAHLPQDRMELYKVALEMLLDRRDSEREVKSELFGEFSLQEKLTLLADLAYWMLLNDHTDASFEDAAGCFRRSLAQLPRHAHRDGMASLEVFVERTGALREPVTRRLDFIHRTFQEYLGARAAMDADDVGLLLRHASDPQWREVVVLAAGHARGRQRHKLISGLISRGASSERNRHRLYLLAVACLETSPQLSAELYGKVLGCLEEVMPPKNVTEANAVASAGETAVSLLVQYRSRAVPIAKACVRALSMIGGDAALQALESFGKDGRVTVTRELIRAWPNFDIEQFAERVLGESPLEGGALQVQDAAVLRGAWRLQNLRELHCSDWTYGASISGLEKCKALGAAWLYGFPGVTDIQPLGRVPLQLLHLVGFRSLREVDPIGRIRSLRELSLSGLRCDSLHFVRRLKNLEVLSCISTPLVDVSGVASLTGIRYIRLSGCQQLEQVSPLGRLTELTSLDLSGCARAEDVDIVGMLRSLTTLDISSCRLESWESIGELDALESLRIYGTVDARNEPLADLTQVPAASRLRQLGIGGARTHVDVSGLAAHRSLQKLSIRDALSVRGMEALTSLPRLTDINVLRCQDVDLEPMVASRSLKRITVVSSRGIYGLSELMKRVTVRFA